MSKVTGEKKNMYIFNKFSFTCIYQRRGPNVNTQARVRAHSHAQKTMSTSLAVDSNHRRGYYGSTNMSLTSQLPSIYSRGLLTCSAIMGPIIHCPLKENISIHRVIGTKLQFFFFHIQGAWGNSNYWEAFSPFLSSFFE